MRPLLIISFSNLDRDPRVRRQIALLSLSYRVTALGYSDPEVAGAEFVCVRSSRPLAKKLWEALLLKTGNFERYYWSLAHVREAFLRVSGRSFDLVLANDLGALPLAARLAQGKAKLVFDAHEYAPLEFEDNFTWRFFYQRYADAMCRKYVPLSDGMMTVCQGIAEEFNRNLGVNPVVVMNTPQYHEQEPSPGSPDTVRMVHHGIAMPSRRLELMIEAMGSLDQRFRLDFMLMPSDVAYLDKLKSLGASNPSIRFIPPVPMQEIPSFLNQYDVGIYILEPNSFNNTHALPNKFFEFIQARLAIAIGPSPEMARLVRQFDCGIVAADFSPQALARELNELTTEKIAYFKQRSAEAAHELCFESSGQKMFALLDSVLAKGRG